ncbi:BnaCnng37400D [Brassica napus]|uniref:BnaCnng37400D protein n=1 Tax=Brassica napus TaxID=3708 RepID=A0A078J4N6_BRANA|nr:BnaCnng37400D [Brassica napus]
MCSLEQLPVLSVELIVVLFAGRRYTLNRKEEEYVVNDHFEQPKDELAMERDVIHEQKEQAYTQVEGGKSKRDCQQQYVARGSLQNQRGHRGARRGYSNARGGRAGDGGYSNGWYESYDNSGGNSYQRSYYNSRGRGCGGGNGYSYNNHRDSNVTVASSLLCLWLFCAYH